MGDFLQARRHPGAIGLIQLYNEELLMKFYAKIGRPTPLTLVTH